MACCLTTSLDDENVWANQLGANTSMFYIVESQQPSQSQLNNRDELEHKGETFYKVLIAETNEVKKGILI